MSRRTIPPARFRGPRGRPGYALGLALPVLLAGPLCARQHGIDDEPPAGRLVGHWGERVEGASPGADVPDLLDPAQGNAVPDHGAFRARKPPSNPSDPPVGPLPRWTSEAWVGRTALEFRGDGNVAVAAAPETAAQSLERMRESLSVAAWVRLDDVQAGGWTQIANVKSSWYLERHGDTGMTSTRYPGFWVNLDGFEGERGFRNVRGKTGLNDGYWHHVAATYDARRQIQALYVDGELENAAKIGGKLRRVAGETINIGGRFNGCSSWQGLIDDVRIYDYALAPEQVRALALAGRNVIPKIKRLGPAGGGSFVPRLGVPVALEATVTDLNGDPLEYRWSAEPADGVAFVPGPDLPAPGVSFARPGAYRLTLRVDDGKVGFRHPEAKADVAASCTVHVGLARSEPVDLGGQANRSRYGTLNRGWFGLRSGLWLPPGTHRIGGVDFELPKEPDTSAGAGRSVIALACGPRELNLEKHQSDAVLRFPVESGPIPVGRRADALFFLHTAALAREEPVGAVAWEYLIRYAGENDSPEIVPVRLQKDVASEVYPLGVDPPIPGEAVGATGTWLYVQRWDNPHPDRVIESVVARSRLTRAAGILVALCTGHKEALPPAGSRAAQADVPRTWSRSPVVSNKVADRCQPVCYARQRVDPDSYLGRRVDLNFRTGLLQTFDVEDYLGSYGKNPRWPTGEYLGKFMQGISRMWLYTGDRAALERLNRVAEAWSRLQREDGWLGTAERFRSWDVWEHKYVLLGLLDHYALTGQERSLNAARRIGDLIGSVFGPGLGDINQSGHWAMGSASILEPMVYLYRFTGDPKYLRFCEYIAQSLEGPTGPKLISIMTTGSRRVCDVQDPWAQRAAREIRFKNGGQIRNRSKGYEMLSCVIGLLRLYQLTGRPQFLAVGVNVWKDISENRLYLAGSSGADECFKDDQCLPAETGDQPAEACVTAHWIYLGRILFEITGDLRYAEGVENALYNYLLASQRPQDCHQSYNTPMNGVKTFGRHDVWGTGGKPPCCILSVMREIARIPEAIWTRFADNGLGILLYNGGTMEDVVQTRSGPVSVRVEMKSSYPRDGAVTIQVWPRKPAAFRLALRVPAWAKEFTARVDGREHRGMPLQWLDLERSWKEGDTVLVEMDLNERLVHGGASYPGHFAFMRGPQVLTLVARPGAEAGIAAARVRPGQGPRLTPEGGFLPPGWRGDQAYTTPALVGAEECALVPFGDATQPGVSREYRTWIPVQAGAGPAAPAAPTGLKAVALPGPRIKLSWTARSLDEDGFRVERKRGDVGLRFHVKTAPAGAAGCVDDAVNVVMPGQTYTYRVAAFNAGGLSKFSDEAAVSVPAVAVPAAPYRLQVTAVSGTHLRLVWTDNSVDEEGFRVERKTGAEGKWVRVAGRVPADVATFTDYGLDPGQTYVYRVQAFNAAGDSAFSEEVHAATPAESPLPLPRRVPPDREGGKP